MCYTGTMKYTVDELNAALEGADSIRDVITKLGMKVNGGNYSRVHGLLREAGIQMPAFPRKASWIHKASRIPDEEFFVSNKMRAGHNLRFRMIEIGVSYICTECGLLPEWNGKPLTLQVDHIDGDRFNNVLENLRFLCPNCHAQTETWGRTKGTGIRYNYCECGVRIGKKSLHCVKCSPRPHLNINHKTKIDWPPLEEVLQMVADTNMYQVGKVLGVSDNAVRKYIKRETEKRSSSLAS